MLKSKFARNITTAQMMAGSFTSPNSTTLARPADHASTHRSSSMTRS